MTPLRLLRLRWLALVLFIAGGCAPRALTQPAARDVRPPTAVAPPPAAPPRPSEPEPDGAADPRVFGPLYFALDSATLTAESRRELEQLSEFMRAHPGAAVTIEGHTCDLGTEEYNLALGHQRANSVREYLVRLGVNAQSVGLVSFGEEKPTASGASEDARAKNRRGELVVARSGQGAAR